MVNYKLTYFDLTGLGEPIRLLFSYGNIGFEDIRIKLEEWPKFKASMPMGSLPVLEVDGKKLYQTVPICRLLGKKVGLAGSTDMEDYEIDNVVETVNDFRLKMVNAYWDSDEAAKEKKFKTLYADTVPYYLEKLEEIAKQNNGHLALKRLTWADIFYTGVSESMNYMTSQDLTANHPNLKKVIENVYALEGVKKWMAKRPKSMF